MFLALRVVCSKHYSLVQKIYPSGQTFLQDRSREVGKDNVHLLFLVVLVQRDELNSVLLICMWTVANEVLTLYLFYFSFLMFCYMSIFTGRSYTICVEVHFAIEIYACCRHVLSVTNSKTVHHWRRCLVYLVG